MILLFLFNCSRKIIRDHKIIREHIRQSRESKLNELGRHSTKKLVDLDITKLPPPAFDKEPLNVLEGGGSATNASNGQYYRELGIGSVGGGSAGSGGGGTGPHMFSSRIDIKADPQQADVLRGSYQEDPLSRSGTLGRDGGMCDMACQTRESLFQPVFKSKLNQSPNQLQNSIRFSTFGYESQQQQQQQQQQQEQLPAVTPPPPRVKHHHHHHHHHHGGTLDGTKSAKVNRIELEDLSPPGSGGGYDDRGDETALHQLGQQHGHSHGHAHHTHQHPHAHQKMAHDRTNLTETGGGPGRGGGGSGGA
uniref:Uncharacterized protein n=1 Tax=Anopheles melas TaxID=34690 RepID=A0A182TWZ1_9DIPT